jgi:hypothetical protein
MWLVMFLLAIDLPAGKPGIGFDDLQYSPRLKKVLAPGGRRGKLYLIGRGRLIANLDTF